MGVVIIPASLTQFNFFNINLLITLQEILRQCLIDLNNQDICNSLWALAHLGHAEQEIIEYLLKQAKSNVHTMTGQNISNLLWALQQFRYHDQEFMEMVENILLENRLDLSTQHVSNITLAFAEFGMHTDNKDKVVEVLVSSFLQNPRHNDQDICNFIYAVSLLNVPVETVQRLVDEFENMLQTRHARLVNIHARQLRRAQLEYQGKLVLSERLEQQGVDSSREFMRRRQSAPLSEFQAAVMPVVESEFGDVLMNVPLAGDEFISDIVVEGQNGKQVLIKLLTRNNYCINEPYMLTNRSQSMIRLLRNMGHEIVEVSELEWENAEGYREGVLQRIYDALNRTQDENQV
eukprot:TRINITY_DN1535_c0_g1_i1.p1 TRINITY_DN1535_c0_g1~~TRINITY_DN1535_c0_g1_i1.p1  ORF type:complete len:348 (+),score=45.99 TRINITY_DN1535_c0_g1_i1:2-1045(+)